MMPRQFHPAHNPFVPSHTLKNIANATCSTAAAAAAAVIVAVPSAIVAAADVDPVDDAAAAAGRSGERFHNGAGRASCQGSSEQHPSQRGFIELELQVNSSTRPTVNVQSNNRVYFPERRQF